MIEPSSIHFLLTYRCLLSCDHCFVWGDPSADAVFTLEKLERALGQVSQVPSVKWIYFEGGEPFLYPPLLLHGVRLAADSGYRVGIVSNGYWAMSTPDALGWLRPFAGLVHDLSISTDLLHFEKRISDQSRHGLAAAESLGIPARTIICETGDTSQPAGRGEPVESGGILFRGRAAEELAEERLAGRWDVYAECPHERLDDPSRVHLDPFGEVHLCQGLSLGNIFDQPLVELFAEYDPRNHPVVSTLLAGGPAELVRQFDLGHEDRYADACHLCYQARSLLRAEFPEVLTPGLMYGEVVT